MGATIRRGRGTAAITTGKRLLADISRDMHKYRFQGLVFVSESNFRLKSFPDGMGVVFPAFCFDSFLNTHCGVLDLSNDFTRLLNAGCHRHRKRCPHIIRLNFRQQRKLDLSTANISNGNTQNQKRTSHRYISPTNRELHEWSKQFFDKPFQMHAYPSLQTPHRTQMFAF